MPIIATDWSGHLDFLSAKVNSKDKKLFAKIGFELKTIQKEAVWDDIITKESRWAFPKEQSIKEQLNKVYKNYGMYKKWAKTLKENVEENFNLEGIIQKYNISIFGDPAGKEGKDLATLKEEALSIRDVKKRAEFAKAVFCEQEPSQKEKIEFLKDLFKGEKVYVLSCGPTLTSHDKNKVSKLLDNNLTVAIKQSFDIYPDKTDFHIYNCANFKEYDYSTNNPISLSLIHI